MTKAPRRSILLSLYLAAFTIFAVGFWGCGPSLAPYETIRFPRTRAHTANSGLRVTFLGVSTLLIQDGTTAFMTDGFFSRPGAWRMVLALPVRPDTAVIGSTLGRLRLDGSRVPRLSAVIALHSHYDHVMDAPIVAQRTNAVLMGSPSTRAVAMRYPGVDSIDVVRHGDTRQLGDFFSVTFIECIHGPPDRWPGVMEASDPGVPAGHYRTGNCHSLLIGHEGRSILVTGTAGFVPGAYAGRHADVVYLSIGGLGKADSLYRASYWNEVVRATGARRVVLIHWDNLTRPLSRRLTSIPRIEDDLDATMRQYCALSVRDRVDLRLAREWAAADPFSGLPADGTRLPGGCPDR